MSIPLATKKSSVLKRIAGKTINSLCYVWNTLFLGAALFHGTSFLYNYSCTIKERNNPPVEFVKFENISGIKIEGYRLKNNNALFNFLNVIKEDQITPRELDKIIIESPNYFNKSFTGQLSQTIYVAYDGYYNNINNTIVMERINPSILRHELVHARTNNLSNKDVLLSEWSEVAKDKNGNNYYLTPSQKSIFGVRLFNKFIKKEKYNHDRLGFISSYAMTDVNEDIAEFVTYTSENMEHFVRRYYNACPIFEKKLNLAVKYNLLPKETPEYLKLINLYEQWHDWKKGIFESVTMAVNNSSNKNNLQEAANSFNLDDYLLSRDSIKNDFLSKSNAFLNNYPDSKFLYNIITFRALAYAIEDYRGVFWTKESEFELKRALVIPNKTSEYGIALMRLEKCHKDLYRQYDDKNPYTCVLMNYYYPRMNSLDEQFFNVGVNDVLVKFGEMKTVSSY